MLISEEIPCFPFQKTRQVRTWRCPSHGCDALETFMRNQPRHSLFLVYRPKHIQRVIAGCGTPVVLFKQRKDTLAFCTISTTNNDDPTPNS